MTEQDVEWIIRNLETRPHWSLHDFREFYNRDVPVLLAEVRRLRRPPKERNAVLTKQGSD